MSEETPPKYPLTPYWPNSPSRPHPRRTIQDTSHLIGQPIVLTEKIDGANTLLHNGLVHSRSIPSQNPAPWQSLLRKHHSWKLQDASWLLYGENVQAVHTIEYNPIPEQNTVMAFTLASPNGMFASFPTLLQFCSKLEIPTVPVLLRGTYQQLDQWVQRQHRAGSRLGDPMEGVVIRTTEGFHQRQFPQHVCKSVRRNHVKQDKHWTTNWKQCQLLTTIT